MPSDADLRSEQLYLDHARRQLARMRDRVSSLEAHSGDAVSAEALAAALWMRQRALTDDGQSTLFFGRLDVAPSHPVAGDAPRLYIGRRHIGDESGDPVVIDWRAEVSTAYYRASRADPMDVSVRRRFGWDGGRITAIEEEHFDDGGVDEEPSQILAAEIERPRVGPMRDIVSTIQPEQDELVRMGADTTVCVQGAPGTGKTAVGLHRAAWLLYAFRERLARQGVLVVGPNRAFLDHIGAVLPALGEVDVRHTTLADLVGADAGVRVRGQDTVEQAVLKGDARMAEVLYRAVWAHLVEPQEPLRVPRGASVWRVSVAEVTAAIAALRRRGVRYEAGRALLPQSLAHLVLVRMEASGGMPDDRVQDAVSRSAPVRAYVRSCWPALTPAQVLHRLWSDPAALAAAAEGILSAQEQEVLRWRRAPRTPGSARWSPAAAVLLDEVADVLTRTGSVGHVIFDEAQDASAMQLRAVGRRCSTGAATVLGDIAQGTTPWATTSWEETVAHLGKPEAEITELTRGFRVPAAIIDFAAALLPAIAPGIAPPSSVRHESGRLEIRQVDRWEVALPQAVEAASAQPGTVGVIVASRQVSSMSAVLADSGVEFGLLGSDRGDVAHRVVVVPAEVAKGLEFDSVVVVEPAAIVAGEADVRTGLRRLYVVVTRAVSALTVLHEAPLPEALVLSPESESEVV
ncbi:hypothetical protein KEM60_03218 [Austwickia sp. TVS 96-490-7B]|uniref:HelD family protein n=1 Tax=Austwickia sp. TVS 96-490-7B TaxID=2830843 RepID=UPI001C58E72C|nr:AAA family ATPase [Austwickia sp. TVS 96-490-7B]MBW3086988.1 hypothetical protein [Austwickia sp. TVS 96-490-7B]